MEGGRTKETITFGYKSIPDFCERIENYKKTGLQLVNCNPVLKMRKTQKSGIVNEDRL